MPSSPEHVVPTWDMTRLWVNSDKGDALTPIDLAGLDVSTVLAPALGLGASGALLAVRGTALQRQLADWLGYLEGDPAPKLARIAGASPPSACTALATVLGMSWNLRSRNTSKPRSCTRSTSLRIAAMPQPFQPCG